MGTLLPPPQKGFRAPKFSAHVYCGQTARWIKMALGMEVGLSPGDFVLDGDPAPLPKRGAEPPSPIFSPCLLWPNGWMNQDGTWHGGRPWSRPHCAVGTQLPSPEEGRAPNFRPIFIVAKRLDASRCHLVWRRSQPRRLCVRWGPSPPSQKVAEPPIFGPRLLWPNGIMDQDATWSRGRPCPTRHCVR